MRSIERKFNSISQKCPYWSSLVCFERAVKGRGFKKRTICHWFNRLVEKDDYAQKDKRAILGSLENLKPP